jgi:hypothetical protein
MSYFNNTTTNPIYDVTPAYTAQTTITRGTAVEQYTLGQIILDNNATVLTTMDFSASTGLNLANRKIAITGAYLISNNGANTPFTGTVDFFNINNPITVTDYTPFIPTASIMATNFVATLDSMSITKRYSTTTNITMQNEILRKATLDSSGKLYFALLVGGTGYTPASGETLTLIVKFYLLN